MQGRRTTNVSSDSLNESFEPFQSVAEIKDFISMCNSCLAFCSDDALCEQAQETSDGNLYVRGHGNYESASVCIAGHPQFPILAFNSRSLSGPAATCQNASLCSHLTELEVRDGAPANILL